MANSRDLLSRHQSAAEIGVSVVTFDRYVREGKGPPTIIYKRRRLCRRYDLIAWLAARGLTPQDVQCGDQPGAAFGAAR